MVGVVEAPMVTEEQVWMAMETCWSWVLIPVHVKRVSRSEILQYEGKYELRRGYTVRSSGRGICQPR